ncbi:cancer/testis antigen 55-like isoform X2 [Ochotona princeps]|uniref:cancer/testis antigen 55-like isoform X2 n=1 Tax=Ochotona princeps TaxID=9978 RepID=UPI0027144F95|nr:cancer/testis antigen 55-like isoform X2 [Ochotona princeps]
MSQLVPKDFSHSGERRVLEVETMQPARLQEDKTKFEDIQGAVASACGTDEPIHLCTDLTDNVPVSSGPRATPVVKEDEASQELKATNVDADSDNCHENGPSESCERDSSGNSNSLMGGADNINHTHFEPYPGDYIKILFSVQRETQTRKVLSVRPRKYKHVHEVRITSVDGRIGVIDDAIFFTLDSLKLPEGYVPKVHDVVSAVIVESANAGYIWRAISITPVVNM